MADARPPRGDAMPRRWRSPAAGREGHAGRRRSHAGRRTRATRRPARSESVRQGMRIGVASIRTRVARHAHRRGTASGGGDGAWATRRRASVTPGHGLGDAGHGPGARDRSLPPEGVDKPRAGVGWPSPPAPMSAEIRLRDGCEPPSPPLPPGLGEGHRSSEVTHFHGGRTPPPTLGLSIRHKLRRALRELCFGNDDPGKCLGGSSGLGDPDVW